MCLIKEKKWIKALKNISVILLVSSIVLISNIVLHCRDINMLGLYLFPYILFLLIIFLGRKKITFRGAWTIFLTVVCLCVFGVYEIWVEYLINPSAWRYLLPTTPLFQIFFLGLGMMVFGLVNNKTGGNRENGP